MNNDSYSCAEVNLIFAMCWLHIYFHIPIIVHLYFNLIM